MDGDRPIKKAEEDRLGFLPVAESLAQVIVDEVAREGLVFGIEGQWGSGKSTLVNLAVEALKRRTDRPPEIIEFSPWLVGARDELLHHLFNELAGAASKIDPVDDQAASEPGAKGRFRTWWRGNAHAKLRRKQRLKRQLGTKLKAFGDVAGGLSKIVKASGAAGIPYTDYAATAIERAGEATKGAFSAHSLSAQKAEIVEALRLLSRRIVVFVDDLDRLEPREASEVLRLIRAVADFPNVIYVLSFDPTVVSKTLQKSVQVDDGLAYLEKIVQVSFRVPRPEAFDLRRWFQDEVRALFADELTQSLGVRGGVNERLGQAIDVQGGRYLETPRDVVRALNSLRLHAVPVRSRIDLADMVWLQLVRLGNPDLYAWIEEYIAECSAIYRGAGIPEHAANEMGRRLDEILTAEGVDIDRTRHDLANNLPGISSGFGFGRERDARRVYNGLGREAYHRFIADRRIGSPEHYRYYFAFAHPAGALRDDQVEAYLNLAQNDPAAATQMFSELAAQNRPQGGVMAEVLIERLLSMADRIEPEAVPGIFGSFSSNLDSVALTSRNGDFGEHRAWGAAERAVELLIKRVPADQRAACLQRLFDEGSALGWLTSILRSEIFAHGHFGDRPQPEDQWLLTGEEFTGVLGTMLGRFAETPRDELMRAPNLLSLLYGWKQGAGNDDAKNWVEAAAQSDAGLLALLSRLRGWSSSSSHGVQYPLRRRDLEHFLDYDDVVQRVRQKSEDMDADPELRALAAELLVAFHQGEERL